MAEDDLDITLHGPGQPPPPPSTPPPPSDPPSPKRRRRRRRRRRWPLVLVAVIVVLLLAGGLALAVKTFLGSDDEGLSLEAAPATLEGLAGTEISTTVTAANSAELFGVTVAGEGADEFRPRVPSTLVAGEVVVSIRPNFDADGRGSLSLRVVGCKVEEQHCPNDEQEEATLDIPVSVTEPTADDVPDDTSIPLSGRTEEQGGIEFVSDELVVVLDSDLDEAAGRALMTRIADETGGVLTGADAANGFYQLAFPGLSLEQTEAKVDAVAAYEGVEDAVVQPLTTLDDVRVPHVEDTGRTNRPAGDDWNHRQINDLSVQDQGSHDTKVAIIDAGVYVDHPDLRSNIVSHHLLQNDLVGADTFHGTHTSGLACGDGSNDFGISGVSSACGLMVYDLGRASFEGSLVRTAMQQASADGARVVNMSLGTGPGPRGSCATEVSDASARAIDADRVIYRNAFRSILQDAARARRQAPLFVVSAGNSCWNASDDVPASLVEEFPRNILVVASTDESDYLSAFSNAGDTVEVAASGGVSNDGHFVNSSIWRWCISRNSTCDHPKDASTVAGRGSGFTVVGEYGDDFGTSMAAPMVTGTAALVVTQHPQFSAGEVKACIVGSSQEHPKGISDSIAGRFQHRRQPASVRLGPEDYDQIVIVDAAQAVACPGVTPAPTTTTTPPDAGGTSTAIIMDVSDSMTEYTTDGQVKLTAAQGAADDVIATLRSEAARPDAGPQEASVISFSDEAEVQHASSTDLDSVTEVIDSLTTLSGTNMGAGLDFGLDELESQSEDERVAILLSDGVTNTGISPEEILSRVVPEYRRAGIKIYTVGFGTPDDLDEDLLRQIAEGTGGTYSFAETSQALQEAFIRARHESTGRVVSETEGTAVQGGTVEATTFEITGDDGLVNISLAAQSAGLHLELVDPLGRPVDASQANIQITDSGGLSTAFITTPLPGEWSVKVRGSDGVIQDPSFYAIVSVRGRQGAASQPPVSDPQRVSAVVYVAAASLIGLALLLWTWRALVVVGSTRRRRFRAGREADDG